MGARHFSFRPYQQCFFSLFAFPVGVGVGVNFGVGVGVGVRVRVKGNIPGGVKQ